MNFTEHVIIVTGASNGIGRAIALGYAERGGTVVIADIDESNALPIINHIHDHGGKALFVKTNVNSEDDIVRLVETTVEAFGAIDIIINNAGISKFKPLSELTIDEWDEVINTNLRSVFLLSREATTYMKKNKNGGSIINIASTRALMSEAHSEAYAASKGGMVAITHALAASLSEDRIRVNAISPGWIETGDYSDLRAVDHKQHFSQRVGKPNDVLKACLYLTSEDNDFITGTNLIIDGGMTRKMIYEE